MNNAVCFRSFETARITCFAELGLGSIEKSDGVGPILLSASCRFRVARLMDLREAAGSARYRSPRWEP